MNNEILWLVCLGLDQKAFTREQALLVLKRIPADADLLVFGQQLIDDGFVTDVEMLEAMVAKALAAGQEGPPPSNPLEESPAASTPKPERQDVPADGVPHFPFDKLDSMSDEDLTTALGQLLASAGNCDASDLHLSAGSRPFIRKHRSIVPITDHILTAEQSLRMNTILLAPHQKNIFMDRRDYDFALAVGHRYRVNLMFHKEGASGSYRTVPTTMPKLDDLGLRSIETIRKLLTYHNGLILITGPVGAGKTTTLAAIVSELNGQRTDHIITVEDPIEVVQPSMGCNVTQREVGSHTGSFFTALKGALREDPDVIVIGELRDLETIEMAISAAETGHLVIGTMHTNDAATTLNRLLDVFPPSQQPQIRASVAESLRGIICQRLLPGLNGGLEMASEIMVSNLAIQALIREGKTQGLRNVMETGIRDGMCIMENVVLELYQGKRISRETALINVSTRIVRAKIT